MPDMSWISVMIVSGLPWLRRPISVIGRCRTSSMWTRPRPRSA